MISDDFLSKSELNQEESTALAMLLAVLVSHNSELALKAAQRLEKLNLHCIQINRESIENFRITLGRINSSFNIAFSLPVIKLLLNILFISVDREENEENNNYRDDVLQFCANKVYDLWSTSNEEERAQIIPYLVNSRLDLKFLTKGVSLAMEEWIKTISALKASFIFELIQGSKGTEENDLKIILTLFVNKFPPNASNDWIPCFMTLARALSSNNYFDKIFEREGLYLGIFDFLYSKKFSISSRDDSECLMELLLRRVNDQKFITYVFSRFTMALGNKIDQNLPYFHPTRLSQCSIIFILSVVKRIPIDDGIYSTFLKNFLNRFFSLVQVKDFLASEIFEFLLEHFVHFSQVLDMQSPLIRSGNCVSKFLIQAAKTCPKLSCFINISCLSRSCSFRLIQHSDSTGSPSKQT